MKKLLVVFLAIALIFGTCGTYVDVGAIASGGKSGKDAAISVEDSSEEEDQGQEQTDDSGDQISRDKKVKAAAKSGQNDIDADSDSDLDDDNTDIDDDEVNASETKAEDKSEVTDDAEASDSEDSDVFLMDDELEYYTDGIKLEKTWDCDESQIPDMVSFTLCVDGIEASEPLTLTKSSFTTDPTKWEGTFKALTETSFPKGETYEYTVKEEYTSNLTFTQSDESKLNAEEGTYTLINQVDEEEEEDEEEDAETFEKINVEKTFDCSTGGGVPVDVTLTLKVDGKEYDTLTIPASEFEQSEDDSDKWIASASFIPKEGDTFLKSSSYDLTEEPIENCDEITPLYLKNEGKFEVTNIYKPVYTHSRIAVLKTWKGGTPLDSVTFTLY